MADKKISQLSAATTPLAGTEVLPIVQSGSTVQVSVDNLTAGKAVSALSVTATDLKTSSATANLDISGTTVAAAGSDSNIDVNITPKGTGKLNVLASTPAYFGLNSTNGTQFGYTTALPSNSVNAFVGWVSSAVNGVNGDLALCPRTSTTARILFYTGSTSPSLAMLIDASQNITAKVGNFVQGTAAKGFDFSANTPAAGKTSTVLNWYEEGTFTPTITAITGTLTSYVATGSYTRVGRLVSVFVSVKITDVGTGSAGLYITGYPFAAQDLGANTITSGVGIFREGAVTGNTGPSTIQKASTVGYVTGAIGNNYVFEWTLNYQAA